MGQNFAEGTTPLAVDPIRTLLVKQLLAIKAGGGGGSGGAADYISYAGPPVVNPPALANIVVDSQGRQWMYWSGAWT